MPSYTIEKLQDKLDSNISVRKKELSSIKSQILLADDNVIGTNIRMGIVMLYAHWEGFIKCSAREYLAYLNASNLFCSEMKDNFNTLSMKTIIKDCCSSNKTRKYHEITNGFRNSSSKKFNVNEKEKLIIDTESNLSSKVLKDILFSLGFEYEKYELKEKYLNVELVERRNAIAHGELIECKIKDNIKGKKEEMNTLFIEIIYLMELFKNQILEAVVEKKYLKSTDDLAEVATTVN